LNSDIQTAIGTIIVNADDWGSNSFITDRTLACVLAGAVSSVSAMVFMEDSERAAALAVEHGVDTGLHLNLTTPFSAPQIPAQLQERQTKITRFLRTNRLAQILYHPGLSASFRYVAEAQIEEYRRLYGHLPRRIDGHHHMHLCANIVFSKIIPAGVVVRRSFSSLKGEMGCLNRAYRAWQNRILARKHPMTDDFFSMVPIDRCRLESIFARVEQGKVEVMTHPFNDEEYRFLLDGGLTRCLGPIAVARRYDVSVKERIG